MLRAVLQAEHEDLQTLQDLLMKLPREKTSLVVLGSHDGSSGPEFTDVQMQKVWESMRFGHGWQPTKDAVRAFVLSAELFAPNVQKHGHETTFSVSIPADADRMERVIEFIVSKRTKDDVVLLFDGRSKPCRQVMEAAEEKLQASGSHSNVEIWFVYGMPNKTQDARIPRRATSYIDNGQEVGIFHAVE